MVGWQKRPPEMLSELFIGDEAIVGCRQLDGVLNVDGPAEGNEKTIVSSCIFQTTSFP